MTAQEALSRVRDAAGDFLLAVQMGNASLGELEELERAAQRAAMAARQAGCSWSDILAVQSEIVS